MAAGVAWLRPDVDAFARGEMMIRHAKADRPKLRTLDVEVGREPDTRLGERIVRRHSTRESVIHGVDRCDAPREVIHSRKRHGSSLPGATTHRPRAVLAAQRIDASLELLLPLLVALDGDIGSA